MKCTIKQYTIIEYGIYGLRDELSKPESWPGSHKETEEVLKFADKWREEVFASDTSSYCKWKKCWGTLPVTCACGCKEGSSRCNGKSHKEDS